MDNCLSLEASELFTPLIYAILNLDSALYVSWYTATELYVLQEYSVSDNMDVHFEYSGGSMSKVCTGIVDLGKKMNYRVSVKRLDSLNNVVFYFYKESAICPGEEHMFSVNLRKSVFTSLLCQYVVKEIDGYKLKLKDQNLLLVDYIVNCNKSEVYFGNFSRFIAMFNDAIDEFVIDYNFIRTLLILNKLDYRFMTFIDSAVDYLHNFVTIDDEYVEEAKKSFIDFFGKLGSSEDVAQLALRSKGDNDYTFSFMTNYNTIKGKACVMFGLDYEKERKEAIFKDLVALINEPTKLELLGFDDKSIKDLKHCAFNGVISPSVYRIALNALGVY